MRKGPLTPRMTVLKWPPQSSSAFQRTFFTDSLPRHIVSELTCKRSIAGLIGSLFVYDHSSISTQILQFYIDSMRSGGLAAQYYSHTAS